MERTNPYSSNRHRYRKVSKRVKEGSLLPPCGVFFFGALTLTVGAVGSIAHFLTKGA